MKQLVTYEDFEGMGLNLTHKWVRQLVRQGQFPKPVKGRGIDGARPTGVNAKLYWRRSDVENYIQTKSPRQ